MGESVVRRTSAKAIKREVKTNRLRRDIQGLRAVAVVVVILDHLLSWPSGGFIGVDIFFVLSGFLITGLLLREHDRSGRISFSNFYRRRVKRILPAALLVLATTVVVSFVVFNVGRAFHTAWDAVWAMLFAANWRFATAGTDYFQAGEALSPLQHFWSLAVEEQFYFVWPLVMVLVFGVTARLKSSSYTKARYAVGLSIVLITAVSFTWALYETRTAPTWAYFSSFSRAWELGVGAIVAVFSEELRRLPSRTRPVIAWTGLAVIGCSVFLVNEAVAFPAPFAALPVLGTVLVVVAGTGGRQPNLILLSNPVSQYIGAVSYSLYLWHFPVIVILAVVMPAGGITYLVASALLIVFCSVLAYELVEDPIRKSRWLEGRKANEARRRRNTGALHHQVNKRPRYVAVSGLAVLALSLSMLAVEASSSRPVANTAVIGVETATEPATATAAPISERQAGIARSLTLTDWSVLSPSLEDISSSKVPEWATDGCLRADEDNFANCAYGDGDKLAVLLGDSVAISYMPALREALAEDGWTVQSLTFGECPALFISVLQGGVPHTGCDLHHEWVQNKLAELQPDLIVLSSAENSLGRLASGAEGEQALDEWAEGARSTFVKLSALAPRVIDLAPPPQGRPLDQCATNFNGPADCVATPGERWYSMVEAEQEASTGVGDDGHVLTVVDTLTWFCSESGQCPPTYDSTPMRADANHLTGAYSAMLKDEAKAAVLGE